MKTYSEKLRDPRWQKMRLKIFERDNWECQYCKSDSKTLMVHHLKYIENFNPWEYPKSWLVTLCEQHHKIIHKALKKSKRKIFIKKGFYTIKESLRAAFYDIEQKANNVHN